MTLRRRGAPSNAVVALATRVADRPLSRQCDGCAGQAELDRLGLASRIELDAVAILAGKARGLGVQPGGAVEDQAVIHEIAVRVCVLPEPGH